MEYAPEHGFTDFPTLFAINRDARFESTKIVYRDKMVIIDTGKLRLVTARMVSRSMLKT